MADVTDRNPEEARDAYFDMLADFGVTKHIGSLTATDMLIARCHIGPGSHVLDVGCGTGLTPCYLTRKLGCRVVGIDLSRKMVARAQDEVARRGVADLVGLSVGNALALPFEAACFDAVIVESVNVFLDDPSVAFAEYVRVTAPGGYVGITESTWMEPPTKKAVEFMSSVGGLPMQAEAWVRYLDQAGLVEIFAHSQPVDALDEARGRLRRYGCRSMLAALVRAGPVLFGSRRSRELMRQATASAPRGIQRLMGYGVYVGRKPPESDISI